MTRKDWKFLLVENSGKTALEIAKITNVSCETVRFNARKHKISLKDGRSNNKPLFNEGIFFSIEDQNTAYWLGFLMADGYNNTDRGYVELTLKDTDISVLADFGKFLGLTCPNITYPRFGVVRLVLHSRRMSNDLSTLGCGIAKTHKLEYPIIPAELDRHFIRGYFDGDGSYTVGNRTFDLTGRAGFLNKVIDRFENLGLNRLKIYQRHPERNNDISYIRYGGKLVSRTLYNYLYDEAYYFLARKKLKFEEGVS